MSLVPWKPFSDLDRFFEDDNWLMPVFSRTNLTQPAMDLYETDKAIIAEVNIPDFDPEKVEVSVEGGILNITGDLEEEKEEEQEKGYWRKEIRKGSFERAVRLPASVQEDKVDATYENGMLKITMPKAKEEKRSKVKIKVKGK